jgi:hypothetical protein
MKNKLFSALTVLVACAMLVSCGKEEPQPTPPSNGGGNNGGNNSTTGEWGTLIDIPEVNGNEDLVVGLETTNKGVYMAVLLNNGESSWKYRMNSGSQTWMKCEDVESYYFWEPHNYYYDVDDRFSYFYVGDATSGLIGMNTGAPFQLATPHPFGFIGNRQMLLDNSTYADTWRLMDSEVQVKQPNELNLFNTVYTLPLSVSFTRAIADPSENCIWLTSYLSSTIYKIYASGTVTSWDVEALTGIQGYVGEIKFSTLPGHVDVYFQYGNCYMRIDERTTLEVFYTDPTLGTMPFTVDNNFLYATDGKKINLSSGEVGTFIPPAPGFDNMELYNDYFNKTYNLLFSTEIEVLKNDGDPYIYSIYENKIFRMPKSI